MTTRFTETLLAVSTILWALGAHAAPVQAGDDLRIDLEPQQPVMGRFVRSYRPLRIELSDKPSETLTAEPDYLSEKPRYGAFKVGLGDDQTITVVVDETDDEQKFYVDRNNNEDLTDDGDGSWTRSTPTILEASKVMIDVDYDDGSIPYMLEFYRFKTRLQEFVLYYRNSARIGTLVAGDEKYKVAVLDENADARFDDLANTTLLIDLNQDERLVGNSDSAEYHAGAAV